MKIWNRFISFALATTLLLTVPLVSFAAGTKNSTSSDFTTVQSASGELLVRAYDLDNGDSVFEQYNDGKLVIQDIEAHPPTRQSQSLPLVIVPLLRFRLPGT